MQPVPLKASLIATIASAALVGCNFNSGIADVSGNPLGGAAFEQIDMRSSFLADPATLEVPLDENGDPLEVVSHVDATLESALLNVIMSVNAYENTTAVATVTTENAWPDFRGTRPPIFTRSEKRDLPVTGRATLAGTYNVVGAQISFDRDGSANLDTFTDGGDLSLVADFDNKTLTGGAGSLSVAGIYDERVLDGTVTYDGVEGELDGLFMAIVSLTTYSSSNTTVENSRREEAVGYFHGSSNVAGKTFSGGFMVKGEER